MACNVQDWSLKDLTDALNNKHIDKKRIAVPMFQRGTRWHRAQEEKFIDSLKSGFPVGTMLFYETIEDNRRAAAREYHPEVHHEAHGVLFV